MFRSALSEERWQCEARWNHHDQSLPDSYADVVTIALFLPPDFRTTEQWLTALSKAMPDEDVRLIGQLAEMDAVDIALVRGKDPGNISALPNLGFVQCLWAGVEKLLTDPQLPRHIPLARLIDPGMAEQMATTAVAHVLDIHQRHAHYRALQSAGQWAPAHISSPATKTVGVLGLGTLGQRAAEMLRPFGFNVIGWRASSTPISVDACGIVTTPNLEDLTAVADIILNLLPLTPSTAGALNHAFFSSLRPGTAFINVARGGHVIDQDLLVALENGQVSRAILDVFNVEPLPPDHPYWAHPRVTVTPHVAAETDPSTAAIVVAANVRAWRTGGPITGLVNRTRAY